MPREEKEFAVVKEGQETIEKLKERYPDELWAINPSEILVLGVTNKERPKKQRKLAYIRIIKGAMKAILEEHQIGVKFYIELHFSDWQIWSNPRRQWVLFHELVHIGAPDDSGLVHHDVEDFAGIVDYHGTALWWEKDSLPDMLNDDPIEFDKTLFERLHIRDEDDED